LSAQHRQCTVSSWLHGQSYGDVMVHVVWAGRFSILGVVVHENNALSPLTLTMVIMKVLLWTQHHCVHVELLAMCKAFL